MPTGNPRKSLDEHLAKPNHCVLCVLPTRTGGKEMFGPSPWAVSIPGCIFQWAVVGFWGCVEPFGLFYFQESLKKKLHTLEKKHGTEVGSWDFNRACGLSPRHTLRTGA